MRKFETYPKREYDFPVLCEAVWHSSECGLWCWTIWCWATCIQILYHWGPWVAQWVKPPTLGLGSGRDLSVHEMEPRVGLSADNMEPA